MSATTKLPVEEAGERLGAPRPSRTLLLYLGLDVLRVCGFVLLLLEIAYALLVAVVVSRRFDLDFVLVLPVFWSTAVAMLNDSFPLALLFATGLVYGRSVADREVTALKSFGLSHRQLLAPALAVGLVCAGFGLWVVGWLAPRMNYEKRDIATLLTAQLRYLGEGWNRDFPFGDHHLWLRHHDGRKLRGIFISLREPRAGDGSERRAGRKGRRKRSGLPEGLARELDPVSEAVYLYSQRGEILLPEDVAREREERERVARERGETIAPRPDSETAHRTIVFRLYQVRFFFSDQLLGGGADSDFMQRIDFDRLDVAYDPAGTRWVPRQPKHLSLPELIDGIRAAGAVADAPRRSKTSLAEVKAAVDARHKLGTELFWRLSLLASFLLYPLLAGTIALLLNAENRYLPFFVASVLGPAVFYGMGTVGQLLGKAGFPPGLALMAGPLVLLVLAVLGIWLLERRGRRG